MAGDCSDVDEARFASQLCPLLSLDPSVSAIPVCKSQLDSFLFGPGCVMI